MNFKKAMMALTFSMTVSGLPPSRQLKGKLIFKLIFMAQVYAMFGFFYDLYTLKREFSERYKSETANVVASVYRWVFVVVIAYMVLAAHYHHGPLVDLMEQLEDAFDQLGPSPATTRFLKLGSMQLKFWFSLISFLALVFTVGELQLMVDARERISSVRFIVGVITQFTLGIYIYGMSTVWALMIAVWMSTAVLFDRLTTFRVDHDLKRLAYLMQMHRKCCEIARLTNRIFSSIFSAELVLIVYGLICWLATDFNMIGPMAKDDVDGLQVVATVLYFTIFVYVALVPANVNHKFNKSLDYILSVGSSFQGPTLTTKKSFALMAKLDLYVTHVTLSQCYVGCGGVEEFKPKHIVVWNSNISH